MRIGWGPYYGLAYYGTSSAHMSRSVAGATMRTGQGWSVASTPSACSVLPV